jgi:hypothetical protein
MPGRTKSASRFLLTAAALALVVGAASGATGRGSAMLLGSRQVAPAIDSDRSGMAEAFAARARATGKVDAVSIYLDRSSTASAIVAGLYTDANGHPGQLLASGRARAAAEWTNVPLGAHPSVSAGRTYWIALLAPDGGDQVRFRDRCCGSNGTAPSETSAQTSLTALPATWTTGSRYQDGPLAAYAVGAALSARAVHPSVLLAPNALAETSVSTTRISIAWKPSGKARGYIVYRNGSPVGRTARTRYTFVGLRCGTSYTLSVAAYDAKGKRSATAGLTASTAPCAPPSTGASLYVSPSGTDNNSCSQSAPCRSFDRAYRVAQPGQVVQVAAGSYGAQSIPKDSRKTSDADVVFQPASGAAVSISDLEVFGNHVTFKNMKADIWAAGGTDVTFQNMQTQTFIASAHQLNVIGGDYGNYAPSCAPGSQYPIMDNATVSPANGQTPTDVLIKGVTFHDYSNVNCPASHMDCLQVAGAIRLTISGNKFYRCQVQDLILTGDFGVMDNITVEQNWFGPTDGGGESMDWNPTRDCPGAIVRYNTFVDTGVEFDCSRDRSGKYYGNIVPRLSDFDCGTKQAVQWDNIADTGTATALCGHGSYVARDGEIDMVNRAAGDYHLTANSEARGRGDRNNYPPTDIDGKRRVPPIDAGAAQH